ncbi:ankyrin repeat and SOCS box protein 3 isoform X2 [Esox lucius]|uniref:ankyrin repeat and SOCS box protein 3 isoform X2 n=1 Tax=Esox lucius TaxID=8010 RepID=UPI001476EDA7|nr:ankyrin repeat and SOCS box protein 3 isoform X2 [Esox lucius]
MDFTECYGDTVSSLAVAARDRNVRLLRSLIRRGCDVDSRDNRGWNALHEAAAAGHAVCARDLLKAAGSSQGCRAYVLSLTHEGESALYLAARRGHLVVVKLLLKAHADVNQQTNDLSSPLYAAVDGGYTELVELFVRKGAEVNGTHTASSWTCLHQAAYKGHGDIVRILVGVCRLEVYDDHRITPLFVAAQYGRRHCLQVLADAGACVCVCACILKVFCEFTLRPWCSEDVFVPSVVGASVNAQAADLATPLLIAAQEGHRGCVELLLDHGADPNLSCSDSWPQLPVHAAAEFGHEAILARLAALTDRSCDRGEGRVSPLYSAAKNDHGCCVALLLSAGFSPDGQDCSSYFGSACTSPLCCTLATGNGDPTWTFSDSARLLIAAGATLTGEAWAWILAACDSDVLQYVLRHRSFPGPERPSGVMSHHLSPEQWSRRLSPEELSGLMCKVFDMVCHASYWLPSLLGAGLEPSLLLAEPNVLEDMDSEGVNYFLEFVNWSTLSPPLKDILDRQKELITWGPLINLEGVPSLTHLCRLRVREQLGSVVLMQTDVVRQLDVPRELQMYLQFKNIPPPTCVTMATCTHTSRRGHGRPDAL